MLEHVVDGDTLVVNIDLGFNVWTKARLRLRGINTPELKSRDSTTQRHAQEAKKFVENQLGTVERIVVQTFQTDVYGRYVADVYYRPGEKDKEVIAVKGKFLNQELLDKGLAVKV